ncbi:MAG: hypothetical protein VX737_02505 [Pseudomonadota bacterium]|nr:hypothetical protein [Pseudomonadota bacterium]
MGVLRQDLLEMQKMLHLDSQVRETLAEHGKISLEELISTNEEITQKVEEKKAVLLKTYGEEIDPESSTVDAIETMRTLSQAYFRQNTSSFLSQICDLLFREDNLDLFSAMFIDAGLDHNFFSSPDDFERVFVNSSPDDFERVFVNMSNLSEFLMTLPYHLIMAVSGGDKEIQQKYAFLLDSARQEIAEGALDLETSGISPEETEQKMDFLLDFSSYVQEQDLDEKVTAYLSSQDLDLLAPWRESLRAQGNLGRTLEQTADELFIPVFKLITRAFFSGTSGLPFKKKQNLLKTLKTILSQKSTLSRSFLDLPTLDYSVLGLPLQDTLLNEYILLLKSLIEECDQKQLAIIMPFICKILDGLLLRSRMHLLGWKGSHLKPFIETALYNKDGSGRRLPRFIENNLATFQFSHGLCEKVTSLLSDFDSLDKDHLDYYKKLNALLSRKDTSERIRDLEKCRVNLIVAPCSNNHILASLLFMDQNKDEIESHEDAVDREPVFDVKRIEALFSILNGKIRSCSKFRMELLETRLLPLIEDITSALEKRAATENTSTSSTAHEDGVGSLEGAQEDDPEARLLSSSSATLFAEDSSNATASTAAGEPQGGEEKSRTTSPTNTV